MRWLVRLFGYLERVLPPVSILLDVFERIGRLRSPDEDECSGWETIADEALGSSPWLRETRFVNGVKMKEGMRVLLQKRCQECPV